jgi:hypothetical protein
MHRTRPCHLLLALVAIASLLAEGCGGGGEAAAPPSTGARPDDTAPATDGDPTTDDDLADGDDTTDADDTAWGALLADLPDDGTVPLDAALQAFALAYGPLPGVEVPSGERGDVDGTTAMTWLAQHADELTPAQAGAAAVALSARDGDGDIVALAPPGPSRRAVTSPGVNNPCYLNAITLTADADGTAPYRPVLDAAVAELEQYLGPLGIPVFLGFSDAAPPIQADAAGWAPDCRTRSRSCTIRIATHATTQPPSALEGSLLHEVVHCFQATVVPIATMQHRPRWLIEGFPTWAAEQLVGAGPINNWWGHYLILPARSLFHRTYDALGLWASLETLGLDPWTTFAAGLLAEGNPAALEATAGDLYAELGTAWAATYARAPERGSAWNVTAPRISADRYTAPAVNVGIGTTLDVTTRPAANSLHQVTMFAEVVVVTVAAGGGRLSYDAGSERLLTDLAGPLCGTRMCECPPDTPNADTVFENVQSASFLLAVTGLAEPAQVALEGMTLEDYCGQPEACLVGVWETDTITVPGPYAELTQVGGAGAVLFVEADGTVTYDFDPMGVMTRYDDQLDISFETASFGVAVGHITDVDGEIVVLDLDTSGTSHTLTAGSIQSELPAGPSAYVYFGTGRTVTCMDDVLTLAYTEPVSGQGMQVLFGRQP